MAKNAVTDWSTTAADNTDVGGIDLGEGTMVVAAVNGAFREMMAQISAGIAAGDFIGTLPYTVATSSTPTYFDFAEDTDNGSNRVRLIAPTSLSGDVTVTLPSSTGTLAVDVPYTAASSSGAASLDFKEDTDNGTSKAVLQGPASLSSDVTITLPGSTGTLALIDVLTTRGDIIYRDATTWARLPKGTSGQVLTMGANDPAWGDAPSSGVPVTTNHLFPVGATAILIHEGAPSIAAGGTTAGSNLRTFVADTSSDTFLSEGSLQTGTWRNDAGVTVGAGTNRKINYFTRVA